MGSSRGIFHALAVGACVTITGCAASESLPATTPAPTTTSAATTTVAATTSTEAPTTTLDRVSEIEAIFRDLEERRLDALYRKDEEAFRALFANEAYMERSLVALEEFQFEGRPQGISVRLVEMIKDEYDCIAAHVALTVETGLVGGAAEGEFTWVLVRTGEDMWGFAYAGSGWACEGPHPLESGE